MSLAIYFTYYALNMFRTLIYPSSELCWWITTSVVLFSVRCVLELLLLRLVFGGVRFAGWSTSAILFHLLCAQHVSDINISIFQSLRMCWWITTSVVLFSVRCVLEILLRLLFGGVCFAGWSTTVLNRTVVLQPAKRIPPNTSRNKSSNTQRTEVCTIWNSHNNVHKKRH
jgi:hypothetical protein